MSGQSNTEGGWPGGWLVAVVAGVIAAILARWIGDVGMAAAVLVGIFVFLVFGVLLGMFWTELPVGGHVVHGHGGHDAHGDDGHGHDAHGHDGHGHVAPAVAVPSPVAAAEPVVQSAPFAVTAPVAEPVLAPEAEVTAEARPAGLTGPRGGVGDDLQTLEGIGPVLEKLCHELGIYHFDQIAAWGPGEVAWMDGNLKGFKGRVTRDKWVRQARLIAEVGLDEFKRRAKSNDY